MIKKAYWLLLAGIMFLTACGGGPVESVVAVSDDDPSVNDEKAFPNEVTLRNFDLHDIGQVELVRGEHEDGGVYFIIRTMDGDEVSDPSFSTEAQIVNEPIAEMAGFGLQPGQWINVTAYKNSPKSPPASAVGWRGYASHIIRACSYAR